MAELLEDANWLEIMDSYEASLPQIEVTMYDQAGNVVPE